MEADSARTDFANVLRGALALDDGDKRRLLELMVRVTALDPPNDEGALTPPADTDGGELDRQEAVAEWLQKIRTEPAWTQLVLLEDAIAAGDPDEAQPLQAAHRQLLLDNPPLAVRRAVVRIASDQPIGVVVGLVGLVLALFTIGRGLFHLAF
jgi:hypothetical protein